MPKGKPVADLQADPRSPEAVEAEVEAARFEGRPPRIRLWGWRVQAINYFKDGMVSCAIKEWAVDDIADVSLSELEQLEAAKPRNWSKLERIHEVVAES